MKLVAAPFIIVVFRISDAGWLVLRRLLDGFVLAALGLLGSLLFFAVLAAAYTLKRALNIDIVPGVDMLPDEEIEALISATLSMLGF